MVVRSQIHPLRWADMIPGSFYYRDMMKGSKDGLISSSTMNSALSFAQNMCNSRIDRYPDREPKPNIRAFSQEAALALYASRFYTMGKNTIEMSPELVDALDHTTLGDVKISDIKFPHKYFWVSLNNAACGGIPGSPNTIDGAYVDATLIEKARTLQIVLTTRRSDLDPDSDSEWPFKTEPYFYVPCKLEAGDTRTFEAILDQSIREGEIKLSEEFAKDLPMPASADDAGIDGADVVDVNGREMTIRWKNTPRLTTIVDRTRENDMAEIERNRQAMPSIRRALALVVNLLAYMSLEPDEIQTELRWREDAPAELLDQIKNGRSSGARQRAEEELVRREFNRIKVVGLKHVQPSTRTEYEDGAELQFSHMRIGHFRTQVYGPRNSLRKIIWVRPVRVRPDLELKPDGGGHQYVVHPHDEVTRT
ncbi:hypothetical protein D3C71_316050 [compost metagenome]